MNKEELLRLAAQARHRAEGEDHDIVAQQKIIAALERKGLDSAKAREVLAKLITGQDADLAEMERLLDELDNPQKRQA